MSAGKSANGWRAALAAAPIVLLLCAWPSQADDHDHDRARQTLEAGEVLPLQTILARLERDHPGQIMEVELEREGARWLYEIKLLRPGGALVKLKIDARSGKALGLKGPKDKLNPHGENH